MVQKERNSTKCNRFCILPIYHHFLKKDSFKTFGTQIIISEVQSQSLNPIKYNSYRDLLTVPFINTLNPQDSATKYRMLACGFPGGGGGAESPDLREKKDPPGSCWTMFFLF